MKNIVIGCIVIAAIVILAISFVYSITTYNEIVKQEEGVSSAWSNVEVEYQRRSDLIPNIVNTVKGYTGHEKNTLEAVISARARATQVTVKSEDMSAEKLRAFQKAQGEIGSSLSRLLVVSEKYPELKADKNFNNLEKQLENMENKISSKRNSFNETAKVYNTYIRRFPKNIIAQMFGFDRKPYFEADPTASKNPEVKF